MIRAFRRWLAFLALVHGEPAFVAENSVERTRRLQRRAAREANRTPFTPKARRRAPINQEGFQ